MFTFEVIAKLVWLSMFPFGGVALASAISYIVLKINGYDEREDA